ncbi:Cycloisomaltooligosaccharide glucanotransferase precursor [compost metagenome]
MSVSNDGTKNTIWATARKNTDNKGFEKYDILHLINLIGNDDDWRNAANAAVTQQNIKVTYSVGLTKKEAAGLKVYTATPDSSQGEMQELKYKWSGSSIVIELPKLEYWSMIVIDKKPESGKVTNFFSGK